MGRWPFCLVEQFQRMLKGWPGKWNIPVVRAPTNAPPVARNPSLGDIRDRFIDVGNTRSVARR